MRSLLQNSLSKIAFVATVVLGLSNADAFAAKFRTAPNTVVTGNWNNPAIWQVETAPNSGSYSTSAAFPDYNDDVEINFGSQITITHAVAQCKSLIINAPTANTITLLDVNTRNLRVYGVLTITGGSGSSYAELRVSTGQVEVSGNIMLGTTATSSFPVSGGNNRNIVTISSTGTVQANKPGLNPLPVELTYFTAAKKNAEVTLTWETASEKNNTGFEVQSSVDGRNYEAVGFVATQNGNASSVQRYAFTHKTGSKEGLVYYRLKQIDLDGSFEYYTAKVVDLGRFTNAANVYPNPFQNQFQVSLQATAKETAQIVLTDMTGKVVYTATQEVQKGANTLNVTLENVPAGLYLLKATAGSQTYINRLVKQ